MFHQWFNSKEYEEKEEKLIRAIKDLGSKPIRYGEQPNYDNKIQALMSAFNEYLDFCQSGHKKEVENIQDNIDLTK